MCLYSNPFAALTYLRRDAYSFLEHGGERNRYRDYDDYDYDEEDSIPDLIEVEDITETIPPRRPRVQVNMAIENIPYVHLRQDFRIQ